MFKGVYYVVLSPAEVSLSLWIHQTQGHQNTFQKCTESVLKGEVQSPYTSQG